MQFADVTNDIAFRKIFGNEQKTAPLISFLNAAFIEADKHNWTKEERIAYDNVLIKAADERQEKIKADEKAREEGKAEGKAEGKIEMIISMHEEGLASVKCGFA